MLSRRAKIRTLEMYQNLFEKLGVLGDLFKSIDVEQLTNDMSALLNNEDTCLFKELILKVRSENEKNIENLNEFFEDDFGMLIRAVEKPSCAVEKPSCVTENPVTTPVGEQLSIKIVKDKERRRKYCEEHREKINAYYRIYHQQHREKENAKQKEYAKQHKEEIKAYKQKYYQQHKEEINAYYRGYTAGRKKAEGKE